eukprot:11195680-Lingulodinium_polyedra.AAC.1
MAVAALSTATIGQGQQTQWVQKEGPVPEGVQREEPRSLLRAQGLSLHFREDQDFQGGFGQPLGAPFVLNALVWTRKAMR